VPFFKKLKENGVVKILDIEPAEPHVLSHEGMPNRLVDQVRKPANENFPGLSVPGKTPGKKKAVFIR